MPEPNELLRTARERTPSRRAPGEHMTRAELAETVCAWLWDTTEVKYELDGHYIAKLERGAVRWPGAAYRSGLRYVLNVASDNELGFSPPPGAIATEPDLTLPSTIGIDANLVEAGDESISLLTFAEQSNVGDLTVEQLHADILRIAQNYLRAPTRPLFVQCRTVRDRAFRLLAGRQSPTQSRDLYAAAGWAISLLAWMSVDLGRPDIAERHTRTAWACAESADHDVLRAWIRATQHTAAFWQDDFTGAAAYARDGLKYAGGTSALFLASAAAVDLARLGRADEAREALTHARRLTASPEESEPGGPFLCTPERAEGIWSDAHLALGDARHTLTHANHSVALFEAAPYVNRNVGSERMARLQQAKAHLALGELDGAAESLEPVLNTPLEYRVRPLVHRLGEVAVLTARYARNPQARQIRQRIREFTQHPDLPARSTSPRRKPRPDQPDAKTPDPNTPNRKTPDNQSPNAKNPDSQQPDTNSQDSRKPNANGLDSRKPNANGLDGQKLDASGVDGQKLDASGVDGQKLDAKKPNGESPDAEPPSTHQPKAGLPHTPSTDGPPTDNPCGGIAQVDARHADDPQAEAARADGARADAAAADALSADPQRADGAQAVGVQAEGAQADEVQVGGVRVGGVRVVSQWVDGWRGDGVRGEKTRAGGGWGGGLGAGGGWADARGC